MNNVAKELARGQKGQALLLAIILLLVAGLIAAPLLAHMGTGILTGEVYQTRTAELYAADAGVEDAALKIQQGKVGACPAQPVEPPYSISVNGKNVTVQIEYDVGTGMYKVTSIAITDGQDGGGVAALDSSTAVEAYVEPLVFDALAGALVSMSDIRFIGSTQHPCNVTGAVYYVGTIDGDYVHTSGSEAQVPLTVFPTQEQNDAFAQQFKDEALNGTIYDDMTISADTVFPGPAYIDGDLYIEKDVTIELAGTIYVEGSITAKQDYTITGSGSIIAVGDIYLSKLPDYGIEGDTVIMSRTGNIVFKKDATINAFVYAPNGDFNIDKNITVLGGLIGKSITIDKDGSFTYVSKASSFGFFAPVTYGAIIKTYTVSP
jgi:hypothetical protein